MFNCKTVSKYIVLINFLVSRDIEMYDLWHLFSNEMYIGKLYLLIIFSNNIPLLLSLLLSHTLSLSLSLSLSLVQCLVLLCQRR